MTNALEVHNLCKSYGDFELSSVSFSLPKGSIMGFVGQNGAGKTTTIRCILNMALRDSGEVKVCGFDNLKNELEAKQEIGVVFDEVFFVETWTPSDIEKAIQGFYSSWNSTLYNEYLHKYKLPMKKRVKDLSRGMKMKLMLAVAMSHDAKLLILDEPTSGLDPVARDELLDILNEYISDGEKSVFFSTHITSDLEHVAGYITLIDNGKIFYSGTKDDLKDHLRSIKGSNTSLTSDLKSKIIGLVITTTGFTGIMRTTDAEGLPSDIATEVPNIEEILIHISKGEARYE